MPQANAVELQSVSRRYGPHWALAKVSLAIPRGETVAVLGPNGCGKTTLLKILATLLEATSGEGKVLGFDLKREASEIRGRSAWLGHDLGLYKTLTAEENLTFACRMRGLRPDPEKISSALRGVGLNGSEHKPVASFSAGLRKRLSLARILLESPLLVLLDEPHTNLDREGKAMMNACVAEWKKKGISVFLASHDHHEVLPQSDTALVLNQGKLAYLGEAKKIPPRIIL